MKLHENQTMDRRSESRLFQIGYFSFITMNFVCLTRQKGMTHRRTVDKLSGFVCWIWNCFESKDCKALDKLISYKTCHLLNHRRAVWLINHDWLRLDLQSHNTHEHRSFMDRTLPLVILYLNYCLCLFKAFTHLKSFLFVHKLIKKL